MELRAFSVEQPWAGLLIAGMKSYEVRTWVPKQLGLFLVNASSGKASRLPDHREEPRYQRAIARAGMIEEKAWPQRAIIGLVEIKEVLSPEDELPDAFTELDHYLCGNTDDVYLWRIGRRWPFPKPVKCDGALNIWRPPARLHRLLSRQLAATGAPFRLNK